MATEPSEVIVESGGHSFKFKVPSLRDEARISTKVQAYIVADEGESRVREEDLGMETQLIYRTMATFELLLLQSSAPWAFVEDPQTRLPKVNPELPPDSIQVYLAYLQKVSDFFRGGDTDKNPPSTTSVESKPNPGAKPV